MKETTMKKPRTKRRPPDISTLPADACPSCGTQMRERKARLSFPVNGEKVVVPDALHLRCPKCGEIVLRLDDMRHLREGALTLYRKQYGLLSSDEIRSIRERLDLTQAALSKLLHLGGNTLSRWEAGRNVQTAAMDILLRLIRDVPGSLDYLREHAA
ncbi:MAG: helix-turn-helix domain-containing protein [Deltaproteobacteria bacterium]|nr:MAG: helix-turn-helix domain-containing protein [Deltaproteobacteria bacterium]